jgi:hypothetical protein
MICEMNLDELQHVLGGIVLEASYMERVLRGAFSALMGSKYAPVVDGHLSTHNLIETCQHIVEVHTDASDDAKAQLAAALRACMAANTKRNRVIHDAWALRPGDVIVTLKAAKTTLDMEVLARTLPELQRIADDLGSAAEELAAAVTASFGPEGMRVEDELRLALGHDISADSGS